MSDRDVLALVMSAERRWMDHWVAGPSLIGEPVRRGQTAPDLELTAEDGSQTSLSSLWQEKPLLAMLWRHLGCGCGLERVERLQDEYETYREAGLEVVVVAPGDIERVIAYKQRYELPVPVLADPDYRTHKAFGLSHWSREQVLYDAPDEFCSLTKEVGEAFQEDRRSQGRPLVDDPWMQSGEFVIDTEGVVRVSYLYNYCADYPDPRIFTTAARLASSA
jgi:peroxiredoxin